MPLSILYRDDDLVVINKPSGLLVHRTAMDRGATEFALQTVRDQIGQHVYPVHRLDRATSGALLFALSSESARVMAESFASGSVEKTYLAIVRGIPQRHALIDYPLKEELDAKTDKKARKDKAPQSAISEVETLQSCEFPVQVDKYPTSRYALVRVQPKTGRKHQIRRHLRHIGHPIIGDTTYGVGKHNRFFAETFQFKRLLLAATALAFPHPRTGERVEIDAPLSEDFQSIFEQVDWVSVQD